MTGRMMDQSSSQPVPGIHIKLNQCTDSKSNCSGVVIGTGTTDGDGKYVISGKYSKKGSFYLSYTVNGIGYHIRLNNPPPKEADLIVP